MDSWHVSLARPDVMVRRTVQYRLKACSAGLVAGLCVLGLLAFSSPMASAAGGPALADDRIRHAVEAEIQVDPAVPASWIDVDVHTGIVTLWGTVDNLLAKERAERLARTVKGVRAVLNKIDVELLQPPSDEAVRAEVLRALRMDPATEAFQIDVRVERGAVTLEGVVDSWQERRLAETVAKSVAGVRKVENAIRLLLTPGRHDDDIEADVIRRLQADAWLDESLIGVMVRDGTVTLTGTVGSALEKSRAFADAWVAGVRKVDASRVEVKWWARDEMQRDRSQGAWSDEKVEQAVRGVLRYDPRVRPFDVGVNVRDGIALLTGIVDNARAKEAAAEAARATTGVRAVRNLLKVRPSSPRPDAVIARDVSHAILQNPYLDRHRIQVEVRGGEVRLSGVLDSLFEVAEAGRAAAQVRGVRDVANHLEIGSPQGDEADWAIQQQIEGQLWRSLYVEAEDVDVSVENGVATLTGRVESWAAYKDARRQAFEGGAVGVRMRLEVDHDRAASRSMEEGHG